MKFSIILILLLNGIVFSQSEKTIHLVGKNTWGSQIISKDGNLLRNQIFNIFDDDYKSTLLLHGKSEYKNAFQVVFAQPVVLDKILIKNGCQESGQEYLNFSRIKEMKLEALNTEDKSKKIYNKINTSEYTFVPSVKQNVLFQDKVMSTTINFPFPENINELQFSVISKYPGFKSENICISKLEFYYQGQKYEIANLEQAKFDYLNRYRDHNYRGHFNSIEVLKPGTVLRGIFKKAGVNPNKPNYIHLNDRNDTRKSVKPYYGVFYLYDQKTYFKREVGKTASSSFFLFNRQKDRVIGYWLLDLYGNLWVKTGNKWNFEVKGLDYLMASWPDLRKSGWEKVSSETEISKCNDGDECQFFENTKFALKGKIFQFNP